VEEKQGKEKDKQRKDRGYLNFTLVLGIKTFLGTGNPVEVAYS